LAIFAKAGACNRDRLAIRRGGRRDHPTAAITLYRRFDKPALGPVGDSLDDLQ
jgi:hypothetical protein